MVRSPHYLKDNRNHPSILYTRLRWDSTPIQNWYDRWLALNQRDPSKHLMEISLLLWWYPVLFRTQNDIYELDRTILNIVAMMFDRVSKTKLYRKATNNSTLLWWHAVTPLRLPWSNRRKLRRRMDRGIPKLCCGTGTVRYGMCSWCYPDTCSDNSEMISSHLDHWSTFRRNLHITQIKQ